ncbi:DUF4191 domain-containing protein [Dietzia sp.]|uniref:DUF4191 domain-containing protein n=1 Tax=Dietzia sp. TaxID=1871616 RepID=UPI002FDA75B6
MASGDSKKSKEQKKAERQAKRAQGKQTRGQFWQVVKMLAKEDKLFLPGFIGIIIGTAVIAFLIGLIWGGQWWMLFLGLLVGILLGMMFFSRRVQGLMYKRYEGQPGAAAWTLDQLRGGWRVTQSVAINTHFDAVHRVVGRPGIVLVGEGEAHRVRPLLNQEKKKIARVVGETPIYELIVVDEPDSDAKPEQIVLPKLNRRLSKYPMNIERSKIDALDTRLTALNAKTGMASQMPKGPAPQGAKVRNLNRTARRRGAQK